jgi:lysophospholipase L1-like esterase
MSLLLLLFTQVLSAQDRAFPYSISYYPFIDYQKNKIEFPSDSSRFVRINEKLSRLIQEGQGKLEILQIGGSHIQADIYSNVARYRLQYFYPGLNGGRGFVFPYSIAKTNNPVNLKVEYTGEWTSCRNVQKKKTCTLGLAGISVSTEDSIASFKIYSYESYHQYDFNKVKIFYEFSDSLFYKISLADSTLLDSLRIDTLNHYAEYFFNDYIDTLHLQLQKMDSCSKPFTFYGASMETDDPGIVYHSIGINGASIPSFLRCQLFQEQLSVISPDLVVLSLGTNDAYGKNFDSNVYYNNYDSLITRILLANPEVALLITVPNDDYLYKRYPNKYTAQQAEVIYKLAQKYGAGVWNLYEIMGGFNSSQTWYNYQLMKYDRIHFTKEGYILKGDLYFNAILKMFDNYITTQNNQKSLLD